MSAPASCWLLSEDYAGLQAQALGLAEAAGLAAELRVLQPRRPWSWLPPALWPAALSAVPGAVLPPLPQLAIGCGGVAAAVGAALRRRGPAVVQVQHPRMAPARFDLVVVNRHDELTGANVVVTRTALHRITPERLAQAAAEWRDCFAHLPRPLVAVLLGGSNGRFRFDPPVAAGLAAELAGMMRRDRVGLVLTPSRRTDPAAAAAVRAALAPLGAWIWDGSGANPYFGMLAVADAIVATVDSVSMISEAVATAAPVMLATLPGRSRRNGLFIQGLLAEGRVRRFAGRLETWPVTPLNDTPAAAAELRHRLRF
ncbi:MAG TPA: mitochondrial fission ELM1 family protein [Acetobacteraceae bacterium]|nr:mitochondrial fission ELM1 family protein [Acetobacteraceae bacterium]